MGRQDKGTSVKLAQIGNVNIEMIDEGRDVVRLYSEVRWTVKHGGELLQVLADGIAGIVTASAIVVEDRGVIILSCASEQSPGRTLKVIASSFIRSLADVVREWDREGFDLALHTEHRHSVSPVETYEREQLAQYGAGISRSGNLD